jgi:hypothetical protein
MLEHRPLKMWTFLGGIKIHQNGAIANWDFDEQEITVPTDDDTCPGSCDLQG